MALNLRSRWKAFRRKKGVRITGKVISTVCKCLLTIFLIGVITASMVGCVLVVYVVASYDSTEVPDLKQITQNQTSMIYVKDERTGEFVLDQQIEGVNKIWTSLNNIPVNLQNAVIAIEDERFRDHYGVDWKRTISAFANLVLHFSSQEYGGSTITQQLIKILTQEDEHKIERKVSEIFRAIEMEKNYATKDEILEAYLNLLPLGAVDGVGAGAKYFFGKDVQDLTLAECAYMASITKGPSLYSPYLHPENARRRQQTVLYKMYELGMINADEYKQAANEEVTFHSSFKREAVQDYYVDLLIEDIIEDLMEEYDYPYKYAENMVYYGGLRIYSAEIPSQQDKVEAIFADDGNFPKHLDRDEEDPQAAIFIMDYDGRVVATVGGRGEKTANRIQNRSTMSKRQPGSAMKPLGAYAPAIDMNLVNYSTVILDEPIIELRPNYMWPPNYGGSKYGNMPLVHHLKRSVNTVAVKLVNMMTPQTSFDFVTQKLELSTLIKPEKRNGKIYTDIDYSPLALGGMTDGVYCSEMAAAYQVFGNGGKYNEPYTYYKVSQLQKEEEVLLLEHKPYPIQAIAEDSAYVMNRLLQQVIYGGSSATGRQLAASWEGWNIFGKTGTTGDLNVTPDVYFCGGTPYYVGACWLGYDYIKDLTSTQSQFAKTLWSKSMLALHKGLDIKDYAYKGDTVEEYFCTQTGLLATSGCTSTELGVYRKSNVPGYCTTHGAVPTPDPTPESSSPSSVPETSAPESSATTPPESSAPVSSLPDASLPEEPDQGQQPAA